MSGGNTIDLSSMSMLEIFQIEAENQCNVLSDGLLSLEQHPGSADSLERLMRAAHSIKGAARIIDMDIIVGIAHAMEDVFVAAQNDECSVSRAEIDTLFSGVDFLIDLSRVPGEKIEKWINGHKLKAVKLVDNLKALADKGKIEHSESRDAITNELKSSQQPSESRRKGEVSASMLDLFQDELGVHCRVIQQIFAGSSGENFSYKQIQQIQKSLQSIKGVAKIVELDEVERIAAELDDLFAELLSDPGSIDEKARDWLYQVIDFLQQLAEEESSAILALLRENRPVINQFIADCGRIKIIIKTVGEERSLKEISSAKNNFSVNLENKSEEVEVIDRSIRVSAEGMNRLMGLAGEVQVESRWLPDFSLKMLRLKHAQDEIYRLQMRFREKVAERDDELIFRSLVSALTEKIELSRNLFNASLMEIEDHTRRTTEISHRLYHEVIANRMRPFNDGIRPFPRMVRDLCNELGKEVNLEIVGEETKVDRDILEKMEAPLNHLIRNALDHGIEFPDEREAAGKSREAIIRLEAHHSAGMLNLMVFDDGRGVDLEKLRSRIIEKKMVIGEVARELTDNELLEFLFLPGFTTRKKVSNVSGRGVGLDVVHTAVHEVRGIVRVSTKAGQGTTFEMQLPLTLSVLRALMVEINEEAYGFPLVSVDHVLSLPREQVKEIEGRPYVNINDERIGLISAQQILDQEKNKDEFCGELQIMIISDRYSSYGLIIDRFQGVRDLVVQPLDRRLGKLQDISAAAILEDGTPVIIVDVEDMVRSVNNLISGNRLKGIDHFEERIIGRKIKRILVADDSITVREVERKMLNLRGYEVEVAVDGVDALNALRKFTFDLLVTDIDMPRMDGIELVTTLKKDPKLKSLPVIIVSYKDRSEDRQKGLYAGADYYLTKGSFQDETLVQAVEDLIGIAEEII